MTRDGITGHRGRRCLTEAPPLPKLAFIRPPVARRRAPMDAESRHLNWVDSAGGQRITLPGWNPLLSVSLVVLPTESKRAALTLCRVY